MAAKKKSAPKPKVEKLELRYPRGYRSFEVASFLAQMDDLHHRIREDSVKLTPAELAWQVRPGMNTIGMLLAHIAIVEVFWYNRALAVKDADDMRVLGIGADDDGMPIAANGRPPRALAGRTLPWFLKLLAKARGHRQKLAKKLRESDLDGRLTYRRPNGNMRTVERRWILYHVVEHTAGHYYQINTLRRMYALEKGRVPRET